MPQWTTSPPLKRVSLGSLKKSSTIFMYYNLECQKCGTEVIRIYPIRNPMCSDCVKERKRKYNEEHRTKGIKRIEHISNPLLIQEIGGERINQGSFYSQYLDRAGIELDMHNEVIKGHY